MFYSSATAFEAIIRLSRRIADTVVGAKAPTPPEIIERAQDIVEQFLSAIGAKEYRLPLLCKGEDFPLTDIELA